MADSMEFENINFDQYVDDGDTGESPRKRKKRVRNWTAEDRARHRVFERSRREAFNERLNELAGLLPNLQNAKEAQLSKHVIVDESVKHHLSQQATIEELSQSLTDLKAQHEQLLTEVTAWRQAVNLSDPHQSRLPAGDPASGVQTTLPIVYAGIPSYATNGNKPRGSVLPDLGTYPDSLVQLASVPTSAEDATALEGSGIPVCGPRMSETEIGLHHFADHFAPRIEATRQYQRMQQLIDGFPDPMAALDGFQYHPTYNYTIQQPENPEIDLAIVPPELRDLWQLQWTLSNSQSWTQNNTAAAQGETDFDAMHFRNNASIVHT